jgi:hypothetical protein
MSPNETKEDDELSSFNFIVIPNVKNKFNYTKSNVKNEIKYTKSWIEPLNPKPIEKGAGKKRKKTRSSASKKCKQYLKNKIKKTMHEYKKKTKGIKNRKQALAIAYSQTKKKHPKCKF